MWRLPSVLAILAAWSVVHVTGQDLFMSAPNILVSGKDYLVSIGLVSSVERDVTYTVALELNSNPMFVGASKDLTIIAGNKTGHALFKIPADLMVDNLYGLVVVRLGVSQILSKSIGTMRGATHHNLIQTDRGTYKPGDEVKFRVLNVDYALRPLNADFEVFITDPTNTKIWKKVSSEEERSRGIIDGSFQLINDASLGNYNIVVVGRTKHEAAFVVDKYTLPKFEVQLSLGADGGSFGHKVLKETLSIDINVKAVYTHGAFVRGLLVVTLDEIEIARDPNFEGSYSFERSITFDDYVPKSDSRELLIQATVVEMVTGNSDNDTKIFTLYKAPFEPKITNASPYIGMDDKEYNLEVELNYLDRLGVPLKDYSEYLGQGSYHLVIQCDVDGKPTIIDDADFMEKKQVSIQLDGSITITDDKLKVWLEHHIERNGISYELKSQEVTVTVAKVTTYSKEFFFINEYYQANQFCATLSNTDGFRTAFYQIVDRTGAHPLVEYRPQVEERPCFIITADMSYEFEIIAYLILDYQAEGTSEMKQELLVRTSVIKPRQKVKKVQFDWSPEVVQPGGNGTVGVSAPEAGLVGVRAVDRSSFLLSPPHDVSYAKISKIISDELLFNDGDEDVSGFMGDMPMGRFPMMDPTVSSGSIIKDGGMMIAVSKGLDFYDVQDWIGVEEDFMPVAREPTMDFGGEAPVMMPDAEDAAEDDTDIDKNSVQQSTANKVEPKKSNQVRKKFPETWLWFLKEASADLNEYEWEAPHTLTTWMVDAFFIGPTVGLVSMETKTLRVTKDLFVTFDLPYSVVRGEKFNLTIFVFNNLNTDVNINVTLEDSDEGYFEVTDRSERTAIRTVKGGSLEAVVVPIKPLAIGNPKLVARAQDLDQSSNNDELHRTLKIEAEGREVRNSTQIIYEFPRDRTTSLSMNIMDLVQVDDYVSDSVRAYIKVSGATMGTYLKGLEDGDRIRMPHGCGEQNLITMVPAVYVGKYLKAWDQLDAHTRDKVVKACSSGYYRELSYVHPDGSFSAFGPNGGAKGSTWLTAYVLKVFSKIGEEGFTSSLDVASLHAAFTFLVSKKELSSLTPEVYREDGVVIHQDMLGGVTGDENTLSFSAFIITCIEDYYEFLVTTNGNAQWKKEVELHLREVIKTLDQKSASTKKSPYTQAMFAYAIGKFRRLVNGTAFPREVYSLMSLFRVGVIEKAPPRDQEDQKLEWYGYTRPTSTDVERNGYALLTYIDFLKEPGNDWHKREATAVHDWLVNQRGEDGFFITTQDTSVALQALAEYSIAFPEESSAQFNVSVSRSTIHINNKNYKQGFTKQIPLEGPNGNMVEFEADGLAGKAYITILAVFNRKNGKEVSPLDVYVDKHVTPEEELYLKVGVKAVPESKVKIGSMVVSVLKMPSGFKATEVVAYDGVSKPDRIEFSEDDTVVSCYFMNKDSGFAEERTTKVYYEQVYAVDDLQPGRIEAMDYYNPEYTRIAMVDALTSDPIVDVPKPDGPTTGASSVTISMFLLSISSAFLLFINGVY